MKLQNVFFLLTFSLILVTIPVAAQEPNLRIYGIGVSGPTARTEGSDLIEARAAVDADGRTATFRLMLSVRNFGTAPGRYKLQV
jgi:hypothetical protein